MAVQKDYVAVVDWADGKEANGRIPWRNDGSLTECFTCQEDLETVKRETRRVFNKYSSMAGAWEDAYTEKQGLPCIHI